MTESASASTESDTGMKKSALERAEKRFKARNEMGDDQAVMLDVTTRMTWSNVVSSPAIDALIMQVQLD